MGDELTNLVEEGNQHDFYFDLVRRVKDPRMISEAAHFFEEEGQLKRADFLFRLVAKDFGAPTSLRVEALDFYLRNDMAYNAFRYLMAITNTVQFRPGSENGSKLETIARLMIGKNLSTAKNVLNTGANQFGSGKDGYFVHIANQYVDTAVPVDKLYEPSIVLSNSRYAKEEATAYAFFHSGRYRQANEAFSWLRENEEDSPKVPFYERMIELSAQLEGLDANLMSMPSPDERSAAQALFSDNLTKGIKPLADMRPADRIIYSHFIDFIVEKLHSKEYSR